jgi:hypothetical protein
MTRFTDEDAEQERGSQYLAACIFIAALMSIAVLVILYLLSIVGEINNEKITPLPKMYEIHVQERLLPHLRTETT